MKDVLSLCHSLPLRALAAGETLIDEGVSTGLLYVLKSGAVEVVRDGVRVVLIDEPGAFLGEISALLGTPPSASVLAVSACEVHVLERAGDAVRGSPELTYAIAQLLARRLQAVTAYLVDIKRQYAGESSHLALMDQVLANLMTMQPGTSARTTGSERTDLPDY